MAFYRIKSVDNKLFYPQKRYWWWPFWFALEKVYSYGYEEGLPKCFDNLPSALQSIEEYAKHAAYKPVIHYTPVEVESSNET